MAARLASRPDWGIAVSLACLIAIMRLYSSSPPSSSAAGSGLANKLSTAAPAAAAAAAAPAAAAAAGPAAGAAAAAAAAAPSSRETTRWWKPTGYHVPDECWKHEELYSAVYQHLRPWMARGITRADLDACAPIATPETNTTLGTPGGYNFRLLLWDDKVLTTSGGIRRLDHIGTSGLEWFQIEQIQDAAQRFGLPSMEFAVGFGDVSHIRGEDEHGGLCPLLIYCKHHDDYDIPIPDGQFKEFSYDAWLDFIEQEEWPAWEDREPKAVGYWHGYAPLSPAKDRFGNVLAHPRVAYQEHSRKHNDTLTVLRTEGFMTLADQRRQYRYALSVDGLGCSTRFQKQLATGTTILKDQSDLLEFFYAALKPWVHYIPTGFDGIEEVDRMVQFLRENDDLARGVAEEARRFAHKHLNEEGRLCYIKVLFEEMKKLMRYEISPEDFPYVTTYDEEAKPYKESGKHLQISSIA